MAVQAVAAFAAFCRQHLTTGVHPGEVAEGYLSGLTDPSPSIRRGCASALGALPLQLLRPSGQAVLYGLAAATKACPILNPKPKTLKPKSYEGYLSDLKDPSPSIQRGCASALGALPLQLLSHGQAVLYGLAAATKACPNACF